MDIFIAFIHGAYSVGAIIRGYLGHGYPVLVPELGSRILI